MVKKLILIILLLAVLDSSFADTICRMTPGGSLDQFQQSFYNQTQTFATNILPRIQKIYWMIWALWGAYELAFSKILGFRMDKLLLWWFAKIFIATTIYHIFLTPNFYIGIIKLGASFGATMGGFAINPGSPSPLGDFTPSSIMGVNNCVATAVSAANDKLSKWDFFGKTELLILQFSFLAVTCFAALYVLILSVKMWLCVFAGFINTMFAGSTWTISWWHAYLGSVIRFALELVFTAALFGAVHQQMDMVVAKLTATDGDILSHYADYILAITSMFFYVYMMFVVPKELAGSLGGTFASNMLNIGGELVSKGAGKLLNAANINTNNSTNTGGGGGGLNNSNMPGSSMPQQSGGGSGATKPQDWSSKVAKASTSVATGQQWKAAATMLDKSK